METEHFKLVALFATAVVTKAGSYLAQMSISDETVNKWIERGGTGLSIIFLLFGLRYLRGKLEDREKRLDEIHNACSTLLSWCSLRSTFHANKTRIKPHH
jgi:hypothetical protein